MEIVRRIRVTKVLHPIFYKDIYSVVKSGDIEQLLCLSIKNIV